MSTALLRCEHVGGASVMTRLYAESPLRLLHPRQNRSAAQVYQSSYGGGLVDGDHIALDVHVAPGATLHLKTQASTKVYRGTSAQTLSAHVERGADFRLEPEPLVCFAGARYAQHITLDVQRGGSFFVLDWLSAGRTARGERWAFSRYEARTTITYDKHTVVDERVLLEDDVSARMLGFDVIGVIWSSRPLPSEGALAAAGQLHENLWVKRFAAKSIEAAHALLKSCV